ncbi:hypothetical protein ACCT09_54565, partial [Rhizobium ruizarguesonis]
ELQVLQPDWDETVLLGYRKTGEPRLAVPVGIDADDLTSHYKPADGRTLFREMLTAAEQAEVALLVNRQHDDDGVGAGEDHVFAGGADALVAADVDLHRR